MQTFNFTDEYKLIRNTGFFLWAEWRDDSNNLIPLTGHVISLMIWESESDVGTLPLLTLDNGVNGGVTLPVSPETRIYFNITAAQLSALNEGTYWYQVVDTNAGQPALMWYGQMELAGPTT